jgi:hypothetical protein
MHGIPLTVSRALLVCIDTLSSSQWPLVSEHASRKAISRGLPWQSHTKHMHAESCVNPIITVPAKDVMSLVMRCTPPCLPPAHILVSHMPFSLSTSRYSLKQPHGALPGNSTMCLRVHSTIRQCLPPYLHRKGTVCMATRQHCRREEV